MKERCDVVVIGAGHNGLVAAILLARAGLSVRVVEDKPVIGGAVRTERPFARAPNLATSTGAYLLGLVPPELVKKLGVELPTVRRDPHYFLPTTGDRYLLLGSDKAQAREDFTRFFSEADWRANEALDDELSKIREDVAPTWLAEPLTVEETAEKYVRKELRQVFVDLCRKPISHYLGRFDFKSDLVRAMYAVTDGFSGMFGTWDTPGTGMNFLVHNMCRLPGADGTWMIVKGGMGTVSARIAAEAQKHGAQIVTGNGVTKILHDQGTVRGVLLADGTEIAARAVVCNADPFRMRDLVGREHLPRAYDARIDSYARPGSTLKVNLALRDLPKFTCLKEDKGQLGTTIHLLPDEKDVIAGLGKAFADVAAGKLADFPTIEWYIHTAVDPSLKDEAGRHASALFVQWVPYEIAGSTWEAEEAKYVQKLLAICDRFAPGTSDLVVDTFALHPKKIESYFGITRGHIHHVENGFGFSDRLPYRAPVAGLYSCSSGTHPAGAVIGAAGHNAAEALLKDLALQT